MKQVGPTLLLSILVLLLGLGATWAIRAGTGAGGMQVAPASAAPFMAPWGIGPTPDDEVIVTQKNAVLLSQRYYEYQKRWQAYQVRQHQCREMVPAACRQGSVRDQCEERQVAACLDAVLTPLVTARHAVHDQAIELEWAAQQLAEKTE